MKKILALLAVVLGVVSCQTEPEGLDVNVGGEVETTVCVSLPEATRANSALGAIENVIDVDDDYTLRYIFQVFYKGDESNAKRQVIYTDQKTVSFPVRLVPGRHYNFVVWADVVPVEGKTLNQIHNLTKEEAAAADYHYNTLNLSDVRIIDEVDGHKWNAMDETRDAFTGQFDTAEDGDKTAYNSAKSINFTLTRPFAKLRVITTDMEQLNDLRILPTYATVEYTKPLYPSFNAFAGVVNDETSAAPHKTHYQYTIKTDYEYDFNNDEPKVLFTDYLFAPDYDHEVNFILTVYDQHGKGTENVIKTNPFNTLIPAHRNHLTTIKGNILTEGNNVTVTVENNGAFYTPENIVEYVEVTTAAEFEAALANPNVGGIVMNTDIETEGIKFDAPAATRAAVTYKGRNVEIDGNGNTLTYKGAYGGRIIDFTSATNGASLTIKNLTIINNVSWIERAINYNTSGTLTLENVTIKSAEGCSLNYAVNLPASSANAKVEIKNCEIWAGAQALNLWGEKTVVNVTNSDLYVVDDSAAEGRSVVAINNDGTNNADYSVLNFNGGSINVTYVGDGKTKPSFAIRNNTAHSTINVSEETTVVGEISNPVAIIYWEGFNQYYSSQDLNAALDAAVPTYKATGVRMIKDLTLPLAKKAIYGTPVAVQMKNGGVFDGCNNTLSVENPEYNAYVVETYGGTIKNLNITTPAGRGIIISSPKEDIYLDNVFINGPGYALNTTEHNGKKLVVTNSTFKGWTSLAGLESVSFTSCTFGENTYAYWQKFGYGKNYDRLIRPYVATTFNQCVFEQGFVVLLDELAASAKITLNNCVCGDVKLTAENYSEYITIELPAGRTLADCVVFE